jgi:hypothetical protein
MVDDQASAGARQGGRDRSDLQEREMKKPSQLFYRPYVHAGPIPITAKRGRILERESRVGD